MGFVRYNREARGGLEWMEVSQVVRTMPLFIYVYFGHSQNTFGLCPC